MKGIVFIVFILFATVFLIEETHGHGVISIPKPWWWAASRQRPCGGGEYNPNPTAVWEMGSVQTLQWWVIALDGAGNVSARINTAGTADFDPESPTVFSVPIVQPKGLIRNLGYHNINMTVPTVNCTGPGKTCTMQFWVVGGGGWYTCATVNITCKGCAPVIKPVIPDVCVTAPNISFCSYKSLTQVKIPAGAHAVGIDNSVRETYGLNQPNTNVFTNGTNLACKNNYRELICEYYFPACGNSSTAFSRQRCQKVLDQDCKITDAHKYIYNCSKFRNDTEISQVYVPPAPAFTSSDYVPPDNSSAPVPNQPYVPPDNSSAPVPNQPYVPPDNSSASQPNVPSTPYYPPSPPSPAQTPSPNVPAHTPSPNVPASTPSPNMPPSIPTTTSHSTSSSTSTTSSSASSTSST